jgi:hypothetical protein
MFDKPITGAMYHKGYSPHINKRLVNNKSFRTRISIRSISFAEFEVKGNYTNSKYWIY